MSSGHARDFHHGDAGHISVTDLLAKIDNGETGPVGIPVRRDGRRLVPLTGGEIDELATLVERRGVILNYSPVSEGTDRGARGYSVSIASKRR